MLIEMALAAAAAATSGEISDDCTWNGIELHGDVQIVESFADIDVEIVTSFPDLEVKVVESFPDDCGEWKFVENFPDFTVRDIEIKYVTSFPGLP